MTELSRAKMRVGDTSSVAYKGSNHACPANHGGSEDGQLLNEVKALFLDVLCRFDRMEKQFAKSLEKESYTTQEAGERLSRSEYTVRQWCNKGQVRATKIRGKGRRGEWRVPHDEYLRIQSEGPSPVGTFDNHADSRGGAMRRTCRPATLPISA
jgi:hypothetical protein